MMLIWTHPAAAAAAPDTAGADIADAADACMHVDSYIIHTTTPRTYVYELPVFLTLQLLLLIRPPKLPDAGRGFCTQLALHSH